MKRCAPLLAVLAIAISGCATAPDTTQDAAAELAGNPEQYVVITVHNRAPLLSRAGSTLRDYDSTTTYGASPSARRELRALANDHRLREVDAWPIAALGLHCAVFELPKDVAATEALRLLARDRRVESVQPLNSFSTLSLSNDPYRNLQRNLDAMRVDEAHQWSRGEKIKIAVVDTGIDATHPDLAGRIRVQRNLVDERSPTKGESHGTAVAGVIAALDNNKLGITGVAPAASLIGLKACWPSDTQPGASVCNTFTLAKALVAALDEDSDIVNLSLGGPVDPLLQRLLDYGAKRGVIYVGAMPQGNAGFPCNVASVICVGSADGQKSDGQESEWRERRSAGAAGTPSAVPQLFAPGAEVLTLTPNGRYDFLSGSSLAAASVSASIALLKAKDAEITADTARQLLGATARTTNAASIDVCAALAKMLGRAGCDSAADR